MREAGFVHVVKAYGSTAVRVGMRAGSRRPGVAREERLVFVAGSPRSGTTFTAGAIGALPGFVDLGEVPVLKAAIPRLVQLPEPDQAREIRRLLQRVRALALVRRLRGVEQTPETAFVLPAALRAFPSALAVHVLRDGRDVVCSLLERGWLSAQRSTEADDAGLAYGVHPRFWVEPDRREEFAHVSDARRAAWAWRRYVSAARAAGSRTVELRYEELVADPGAATERLARALGGLPLAEAFGSAHSSSVGRWRRDLSAEQLADVEAEAGPLLAELGYA